MVNSGNNRTSMIFKYMTEKKTDKTNEHAFPKPTKETDTDN